MTASGPPVLVRWAEVRAAATGQARTSSDRQAIITPRPRTGADLPGNRYFRGMPVWDLRACTGAAQHPDYPRASTTGYYLAPIAG